MKRIRSAVIWICLLSCTIIEAQIFNLQSGRERITSLDGLWHFHIGDDPAWANPDFDDSKWPLIRSDRSWTKQGYPAFTGYAWYRFTVEDPGDGRPLDLLLTDFGNGYQVYANGKLIGNAGSAIFTRDPVFVAFQRVFALTSVGEPAHSIHIALRVWTYQPVAAFYGSGPLIPGNEVGDPAFLKMRKQLDDSDRAVYSTNEYAFGVFAALIGFTTLALFLFRSKDKEYLWFSILLLAQSASSAFHLWFVLGPMHFLTWRFSALSVRSLSLIAALVFFSNVLRVRRSFLWWMTCVAAGTSLVGEALIYFQWTSVGVSYAVTAACYVPAYSWIIAELSVGTFRRDVSAQLLLAPATLFYGMGLVNQIDRIIWQLNGGKNSPQIDVSLFVRPFPIQLSELFDFIFILALLVFLVRRFALARKEEERLAAEFEAAKAVQSLLIPTVPPSTPGFQVEAVYLPANEVGGDFFQVLPAHDGSLLVAVGDVSGKGLQAAMTVSAIMGALRGCTSRKPAEVLAYLNRVLHGRVEGFVTCCVALIMRDGAMTIANAGNPAPYCDSEEMAVEAGLPLGMIAEISYLETRRQIAPGERLIFVSDGVVEATNKQGELYGFERTKAISAESADKIARAAELFGQQDDITVLTVTRTVGLNPAMA